MSLINPKGNRGKSFTVASDGLLSENTNPQFPKNSNVLYEGKTWTVSAYDPYRMIYTLKNGEIFVKVTEALLTQEG